MCLILFAWQAAPHQELVLAANRDEFHARPTAPATWWSDRPNRLGGRDLEAGGTWLALERGGRFAAVTNYREPLAPELPLGRSRGALVTDYLDADEPPGAFAARVLADGTSYRGFNLLLGAPGELVYVSNRHEEIVRVPPGVHGLSNHLLDTDWPKVRQGKQRLGRLLRAGTPEIADLLDLVGERGEAPGPMPMPMDEGGDAVRRHLANHAFILSPVYGTRSSTVLRIGAKGAIDFTERSFAPDGTETGIRRFEM